MQIFIYERKTIIKRIRFAPIHYCELRFPFCFFEICQSSLRPHLATWRPWPFHQASLSSSGTKIQILIYGRKVITKRIRFAPIPYCELRFQVCVQKCVKVLSGPTWPPGDLATWPFLQVSPSTSGTKIKIFIYGRRSITKRMRFAPIHYREFRFHIVFEICQSSIMPHLVTWPPRHSAIPTGQPGHFRHQVQDFNLWAQNYYKTY